VLAVPLLRDGRPFGALVVYSPVADAFDEEEIRILSELADDLSYGILAHRARAELASIRNAEAE
jgi:GAF domain-containing protein